MLNINIKTLGMELTPAISDYVTKRVGSIEKFLKNYQWGDVMAQVEVGKSTKHHKTGGVFHAEVHLTGAGLDHYAVAEKDDLYASIDAVKDEIVQELKKAKGKRETLLKRGGQAVKNLLKGFRRGQ